MGRRRRKFWDLQRRLASQDPKRRFLLICEGKNTEPLYFKALARTVDGATVRVDVIGHAGSPDAIVTAAEEAAKSRGLLGEDRDKLEWYEKDDQVWAVFDRDTHAHFDGPIQRCIDLGIGVARSNPCFEVWLVLHYQDYHRPDDHHQVQKWLAKLCPSYDRNGSKVADFEKMLKNLPQAESRAEKQLA